MGCKNETGKKGMVLNAVVPPKNKIINTMPVYPCLRGLSCAKCSKRRSKDVLENPKNRVKGTLLDAFRKAVNALDELDLVPRTKKPRGCKLRPAALTIYVRKRTDKVYNAIRLNQKTVEELKLSLGDKYSFSSGSVTSFKLSEDSQRQR